MNRGSTVFTFMTLAAFSGAAAAQQEMLSGAARVIDAATLEIAGHRLRLYGIAAPVTGDVCPLRGTAIDCGRVAATALMDLTAGATVSCQVRDASVMPVVAWCSAGGYDLSEGMVYTGWARPLPDAPGKLRQVEQTARERGHGLWRGAFPDSVTSVAEDSSGG